MTPAEADTARLDSTLRRAGVRRAKIEVPVPVPPTNAWMVGEGEVTLVDCGPLWGDALERLRAPLSGRERVARLLVTHGHPDHHGAAAALVKAHGCAVNCHGFDARAVREFHATLAHRYATWAKAARENGMPESVVAPMAHHYRALDGMGDDVGEVRSLEDGERIEAGALTLEVIHLPGHTAGSVAFLARKERLLFSGDSVLPGITPNPFFEGLFEKPSGPGPFLESVGRLRGIPVDWVLPGHGEPLSDLPAVLDLYERHHAERRAAILAALRGRLGATGFEVVETLFPGASRIDMWLAMAEVFGHLQRLEAQGEVERGSPGPPIVWRARA